MGWALFCLFTISHPRECTPQNVLAIKSVDGICSRKIDIVEWVECTNQLYVDVETFTIIHRIVGSLL